MKVFSTLLLTFVLSSSFAQSIPYYGVKGHFGSIIAHSPELRPVSDSNPYGFQVEASWLKTGDKAWKTCACYGRTGLSFAYFNYQNPSQLGSSYNLTYFAEPYLSYRKKSKISMRAAFGVSYLNQVFNQTSNPENLFFSTPISFFLMLGVAYNYHLTDELALNASVNYNHISNGGQKQPNKGMNFPTISLGVDRIFDFEKLLDKSADLKSFDPNPHFYVTLFGSLRSANEEAESSDFLRMGFAGGVIKPLSRISGLTAGLEVGFDGSYQENIENQSLDESSLVSAFLFGHRFIFGRVTFFSQFGAYITRPQTLQPKWLFQNYALNYQLTNGFAIGTGLIAYGRVADHMDFRITWFP